MQCQFDGIGNLKCENYESMYFQRGQNLGTEKHPKFKMIKSSRHILYTWKKYFESIIVKFKYSILKNCKQTAENANKYDLGIVFSDRPFYTLDSFFINEKVT